MNLPWDVKGVYLTRTPYAKSGKKWSLELENSRIGKEAISAFRLLKLEVGLRKL